MAKLFDRNQIHNKYNDSLHAITTVLRITRVVMKESWLRKRMQFRNTVWVIAETCCNPAVTKICHCNINARVLSDFRRKCARPHQCTFVKKLSKPKRRNLSSFLRLSTQWHECVFLKFISSSFVKLNKGTGKHSRQLITRRTYQCMTLMLKRAIWS